MSLFLIVKPPVQQKKQCKRFIYNPHLGGKGVNMMLSPEYKLHIICSFDAFCKTVMRFEAHTCYQSIKRKQQREISLNYLLEEISFETSGLDDYFIIQPNFKLESHFYIKGQVITIENERLALAMIKLPALKRDVVLLRFFWQ